MSDRSLVPGGSSRAVSSMRKRMLSIPGLGITYGDSVRRPPVSEFIFSAGGLGMPEAVAAVLSFVLFTPPVRWGVVPPRCPVLLRGGSFRRPCLRWADLRRPPDGMPAILLRLGSEGSSAAIRPKPASQRLLAKPLRIVQFDPWAGMGRSEHPPKSGGIHIRWCPPWVALVVRGRVEPPTFRFSGVADCLFG